MSRHLGDDVPLIGWGDDRQKETVVLLVVIVLAVGVVWWLGGWGWHRLTDEPTIPRCHSSTDVLVQIQADTLAWHAGDFRCVPAPDIHPTERNT